MSKSNFPYKFHDVDENLSKELMELLTGFHEGFVQVGPKKYFFPSQYKCKAELFYSLPLKTDDVWVVTYPRSGTTWVQEIVWLIENDLDFETAKKLTIEQRYPYLEGIIFHDKTTANQILESTKPEYKDIVQRFYTSKLDKLKSQSSCRFIKSHLPFSLLPQQLLETSKVVYVIRDPRDVALSFHRHQKLIKLLNFVGDFRTYWKYFKNGLTFYGPYFEHIKEAWELRNHKNMLFLFYEDLCNDLPNNLKRISNFLNKNLNEEQISLLCEYLKFDNFKTYSTVNFGYLNAIGLANEGEEPFFYQGKPGGWKDKFEDDLKKEAQEWIENNLKGTDIGFSEKSDS